MLLSHFKTWEQVKAAVTFSPRPCAPARRGGHSPRPFPLARRYRYKGAFYSDDELIELILAYARLHPDGKAVRQSAVVAWCREMFKLDPEQRPAGVPKRFPRSAEPFKRKSLSPWREKMVELGLAATYSNDAFERAEVISILLEAYADLGDPFTGPCYTRWARDQREGAEGRPPGKSRRCPPCSSVRPCRRTFDRGRARCAKPGRPWAAGEGHGGSGAPSVDGAGQARCA